MRATAFTLAMTAGAAALAGNLCDNCAIINLEKGTNGLVEVEFYTFLGSDEPEVVLFDATGTVVIEADDFASPSSLTLHALNLSLTPPASFAGSLDFGVFLGMVDAWDFSLTNLDLVGDPVPSDGTEARGIGFAFSDISIDLSGTDSATYSLIAVSPGSPTNAIDNLPPQSARLIDVVITTDGDTLQFSASLALNAPARIQYEPELVELRVELLEANLTGSGEDPTVPDIICCNRADVAEPYGLLDLADVTTFAQGFLNQQPVADIVEPFGLYDLADINEFVALFNAGCPNPGPYDCYYPGIAFHEGDGSYAFGRHRALTAGLAATGMALMLGFSAARRKKA